MLFVCGVGGGIFRLTGQIADDYEEVSQMPGLGSYLEDHATYVYDLLLIPTTGKAQ